ncbi:DUF1542 domain-containing protein, partial [Streptococcus suis]|uniref:DUF1542 domain-containing protein n=1 Tax=Streptococcus suis TaxID=1307 RepID=UPI0038BC76B6
MSSKDMFRKEQRFSFRKFSFGLASAVIANVIFGGAIANTPVVHANTTTETAAVATSERIASIPYTVNIVDQAGKVVETKEKKVLVYTVETIATATEYLTADLVPEGYAIVSGLGEVTLTEKADNIFTVKVDKIAPEAVATTTTAESATSETSTAAATPEPASLAATQPTPVTSEVAEAEVAPTTSEETAKPTERTAYLSYITHYVNEANETVDRRGHLVAVTTTDETAKTQVTVSASENMPSGYELAQDKAEVVLQLVEKQTNVLVFAVTKKSKEEEIAESQLSNRDVLMRLSLEADLLADEALRQVAKEQAGNTALETAANDTKAAATAANQVLANAAATEVELDAQIDTVRTSTQNLAAEMLKVDKDGILTAMLDATQVSRPDSYSEVGTEAGPFHQNKPNLTRYLFVFGTSEGDTEDAWGAKGTPPVADKINASRALVPAGTITNIVYNDGTSNLTNGTLGSNLTMDTDGFLNGSYNHTAGGAYTRKLLVTTDTGTQTSNDFTTYAYTDQASSTPVKKLEGQTLTQDEVFGKMGIVTTSATFQNTGKNIPTVPADEYSRSIVGYRLVTEDAYGNVTKGELVEQTDLAQFPTDKDYQVKVKTTNVYGQTIYNWVNVDYDLKASMPTIGVDPGVLVKNGDNRQLEALFVFGNVSGTTEAVSSAGGAAAPDFDTAKATKAFLATDPETEAAKAAIAEINANGSLTEEQKAEYIAKQEAKKENVTLTYGVPGNVTAYEAGKPETLTTNGHPPMSAETGNLGREKSNQLRLDDEGKLTGEFPAAPGGFYSRVVKMTDTAGNVSYSNPFFVVGYTDKRADNTDLTVAAASDLTEANIFGKLTIDVTSGSGSTNRSLTVPTSEYTRKIVGYRLAGETEVKALSTATLNTLPAGENYEIKVETTNPYGQTIYNWVPVNDTRTKEISIQDLFVFNNSPIQTVDGTNKVKVVTVEDKDGVQAIDYYQTPSNTRTALNGVSITTENSTKANQVDGYVTGTPSVGAIGFYTRSFGVTDNKNNLIVTYPNVTGGEDKRQVIHVMDTNVTGSVEKQAGDKPTKDEILAKVEVKYGTPHKKITDPTSMYSMDLAPDQTLPTEPGEYEVKVRVVTASGVYKDVPVKVKITAYKDVLTATAAENTSLVPGSGTAATQPIVINDANGAATTAPSGTTYAIDPAFKAEKEALGYKISVDEKGVVSVEAPAGQEADINVPVTVTYPDKTTDSVSVPFKVNQKDLAQLKAKEAIDEKLADETKALEDKKNAEIAAITNNPDLTQEQKDAAVKDITDAAEIAKKALNDAAGVAKDNVDAATTPEEAKAAQTAGETTLADLENGAEAALDLITAKAEAKDAIADKLADEVKDLEAKQAEAEKAIDASTMTPEEKDAAKKALQDVVDAEKAKLEDAAKKATDAVDAATTPADVKAAEIAGETALTEAGKKAEEPIDLIIAKTAAKDVIANKLADEIKDLEAKQAEAEKAIDASTMTPEEKDAAKKALQDVVNAEKDKLEDAAKKATDAIDAATTPADVAGATKAGQDDLTEKGSEAEKAVELAKDKELAKEAIRTEAEEATKAAEKLADDAIKAINDNPNLSDAEKQAAIDKVNDAAKKALDAIADNAKAATEAAENAQALADLEAAKKAQKDADKAAIDTATPLVDAAVLEAAKQDALNKLEDDAAKAKETIAANPNLSAKEVDKALADLEKDLAKAKDAVNAATTPEKVQTAEDKGVDVIAGDVLDAAQLDALNKLEDDTKETIAAIEANPNLTEDEKKAAIAKAEDLADDAKSDILTAETPEAVQAVEEKADKDLAKEELKAAADDAKKAIDANPNLTPEEKKVAKDALDAEVAKATEAIDKAATPADVDAATLAGEKVAAKAEVAAAADDAKKAIDANPNLTPEEKKVAKDALDAEVAKATEAIDKAETPAAVNTATLAGEKAAAKAEVEAAADDAIAAINANPNLDDTAKAAAIKAVEDAAKTATEAIDAAKTPADVNAAT